GWTQTKIRPADARPMLGKLSVIDCERFFLHRKNAAAAKNRNAFRARFEFVRCIGSHDPRLVRLREMRRVVNRCTNYSAVRMRGAATGKETLNDSAHSEQRREAYEYNSSVFIALC